MPEFATGGIVYIPPEHEQADAVPYVPDHYQGPWVLEYRGYVLSRFEAGLWKASSVGGTDYWFEGPNLVAIREEIDKALAACPPPVY